MRAELCSVCAYMYLFIPPPWESTLSFRDEGKPEHDSPWTKGCIGALPIRSCSGAPYFMITHQIPSLTLCVLIFDAQTYHTWMLNPELRALTASEPLSLDEEHEMQRTSDQLPLPPLR